MHELAKSLRLSAVGGVNYKRCPLSLETVIVDLCTYYLFKRSCTIYDGNWTCDPPFGTPARCCTADRELLALEDEAVLSVHPKRRSEPPAR